MKKRFIGVLLALAALGLMASSAMAVTTIKFTLKGTVGSETTPSFSEEISFSADDVALLMSDDIPAVGNVDPETLVDPKKGLLSPDIVAATGTITISSSSDTIKFTTGGDDAEVLETSAKNKDGAAFFVKESTGGAKVTVAVKPSAVKGIEHSTSFYIPVQVRQKKVNAKATVAADDKYEDINAGKCVVYVKIKVNFKVKIEGVGEIELPRVMNGKAGANRLVAELLTLAQQAELMEMMHADSPEDALNLLLNKTIANDFGHSVDDADINGQATVAQVKAVADSGIEGIMAVLARLLTSNPNTSAYVLAIVDLSDEIRAAVADGTFNLYFLDITKKAGKTSVAEYGKPEAADDARFYIYDADGAEFREPDASDKYEVLFVAFDRRAGTFQPFFATGEAPVDPSNPSTPGELSNPSEPSTPGSPSTPESPSSPSSPSNPSNPSGSSKPKSSGSSGCDMGMVSGLAILLAALLPLRKVRK